jgi:hypothetical protein
MQIRAVTVAAGDSNIGRTGTGEFHVWDGNSTAVRNIENKAPGGFVFVILLWVRRVENITFYIYIL